MNYRAFIPFVLLVATTAYAQNAPRAESYCAGLTAMSSDLDQLQSLRPDSSPSELNAIIDRLEKDIRLVEKDIAKVGSPASKQFMASSEALLVKARAVPQGMTMDQVKTRIQDDVDSVRRSKDTLATDAHCATATPGMPQGSAMPQESMQGSAMPQENEEGSAALPPQQPISPE